MVNTPSIEPDKISVIADPATEEGKKLIEERLREREEVRTELLRAARLSAVVEADEVNTEAA